MLVLSRKVNESIIIAGNIRVTMSAIRGRQVRLAVEAPPDVHIVRAELVPAPAAVEPRRSRLLDPPSRAPRNGHRKPGAARLGR
jgi:carbon storage regulator